MEITSYKSIIIIISQLNYYNNLLTILLFPVLFSIIYSFHNSQIKNNIILYSDFYPPLAQWLRMKDKISYFDFQEPCWAGFAHLWPLCVLISYKPLFFVVSFLLPALLSSHIFAWLSPSYQVWSLLKWLLLKELLQSKGHPSLSSPSVILYHAAMSWFLTWSIHILHICLLSISWHKINTSPRSDSPRLSQYLEWLNPHLTFSLGKLKLYFHLQTNFPLSSILLICSAVCNTLFEPWQDQESHLQFDQRCPLAE